MARTREFDFEKAIDKATKLFWLEGYKKTSIQKLMKTMGLGESSFYNSFKNKRDLYLQCLKYYNSNITSRRAEALNSPKPIQKKLRDLFNVIFDDLESGTGTPGCLMTNSLSFEVLKDAHLRKYVLGEMDNFRLFLKNTFQQAIENDELSVDFDSILTSELVVTYLQGLFKISMTTTDYSQLRKQTEYFLKALGL